MPGCSCVWRRAMELVADMLTHTGFGLLVAPTGYGKTKASPCLYERLREAGTAGGLIHVQPLRSLVAETCRFYASACRGRRVGYQAMMELEGCRRAPYFLADLNVTTIDSFLWNILRTPVHEYGKILRGRSEGHYYTPLAAVLTSLVVLDEAHLVVESRGGGVDPLVLAAGVAAFLLAGGAPVLMETATLPPATIDWLLRWLRASAPKKLAEGVGRSSVVVVCRSCRGYEGYRRVGDPDFEALHSLPWRTIVYDGGLVEAALWAYREYGGRGARVLVVANTVEGAVEAYNKLLGAGASPVLVHGRLSAGDRARAERELGRARVVVATQVVEAGVDVDADVVVTEPASPQALVQRAGRACRRPGERSCEPVVVVSRVVTRATSGLYPDAQEALEALEMLLSSARRGIDWRLLDDRDGYRSFVELVVARASPLQRGVRERTLAVLLGKLLQRDVTPSAVLDLLKNNNLCSLVRDSILVRLAVGDGDYATVGLGFLQSHPSVLDIDSSGAAGYTARVLTEAGVETVEGHAPGLPEALEKGCWEFLRWLQGAEERACENTGGSRCFVLDFLLRARRGAYRPGLGLLPQSA